MNKKIFLNLLLMTFFLPALLIGSTWTTTAKVSCFSPKSSHLRKVYGDAFINYEIELARSIFCNWEIWSALDYYTESGHLPQTHQSSTIHVLPLSLGLSYNWKLCRKLYWKIGIGGAYTYANFYRYDTHKNDLTKWGGGAVFKTSLNYFWNSSIFVNVFCEYFYQHFNRHRYLDSASTSNDTLSLNASRDDLEPITLPQSNPHKRKPALNVGGTKIGIGVGYIF